MHGAAEKPLAGVSFLLSDYVPKVSRVERVRSLRFDVLLWETFQKWQFI